MFETLFHFQIRQFYGIMVKVIFYVWLYYRKSN